ncbi:hypothetical Protein YC6258_01276 [Gynuella sunshinyii YC6258]|uniref:Uncharacterized protein n=1 Tax=Gynuella sunshinyii YC6258 TaxID=1445510 RepID=A0A0C5VSQ6_9GAMM|nr:hypothetical Protein YC6258_01276 [Gynuella sunshinyii YC6258]
MLVADLAYSIGILMDGVVAVMKPRICIAHPACKRSLI